MFNISFKSFTSLATDFSNTSIIYPSIPYEGSMKGM